MKRTKLTCIVLAVLMISSVLCGGVVAQAAGDTPITEPVIEKEEKCNPDFDFPGINPHTGKGLRNNPPAGQGDFRVENYATGTGNGNFWWRGYVFKPSRDVVVVGMWGGTGQNCNAFAGAILRASLIGDPEATNPAYQTHEMLANVTWPAPGVNNTPYYESFGTATITLYADEYYFIGQGQNTGNTGSTCHYNTGSLDYENLENRECHYLRMVPEKPTPILSFIFI